uniref:Uncharacterized protein n=1 Tax=Panagrellus redivivus TaxID=6233 RepID=A0A7E4UZA8_PANRE
MLVQICENCAHNPFSSNNARSRPHGHCAIVRLVATPSVATTHCQLPNRVKLSFNFFYDPKTNNEKL